MINQYIKTQTLFVLCLCCTYTVAEPSWQKCDVPGYLGRTRLPPSTVDAVVLEADQGFFRSQGTSTFEGNVIIQHGNETIWADKASYDNTDASVTASGNVLFSANEMQLKTPRLNYQMRSQTGTLEDAEYSLGADLGHGSSTLITQQGKEKTHLKTATFSTCPVGHRSWHIVSSDINLNHTTQKGTARHVTFKAGNIPLFYSPYFSFPLQNQRVSGFLSPNFRVSERSGSIFSIPYYVNLAPNYDVTLTPNLLTKRGIKLDTEFRYLTDKNEGIIDFEYLSGDKVDNNQDRSLVSIQHKTKLSDSTVLSINATDISDVDYFEDFGDSLVSTSVATLERRIDIARKGKDWLFNTSLQNYKVLDSADAPYSRLPELQFQYTPKSKIGNTQYYFETEVVNFDRDNDVTGIRFDINTIANKRYGSSAWYVEPSVQLRHTLYSLSNIDLQSSTQDSLSIDSSPSRTIPTASIDSGLFFERSIKSNHIIQTLEPRLLYTFTPFKDQSNIPVFDAAATSFSTSTRLFAKNRFTGKDRIGDSNQLTVALTSRLINTHRGQEMLTASIGQIFFFDNRRVTLPGEVAQNNSSSELAFELAGRLNDRTRIVTSTFWDTQKEKVVSTETRLHYRNSHDSRINLSYRKLDQELKQAAISFSTPLRNNWSLVGKFERDLINDRNLESLGGVEYTNCCWKVRLVGRRFLTADNVTYDNVPFIEFQLKGLGSLGTGATELLEEQIYGYEN